MNIKKETLAREAANAEADRKAVPPLDVRPQRRAGATNPAVLSVRLTTEQYEQLSERASNAGVPTSALARDIILAGLGDGEADRIGAKLEEVLRRTLSPSMLSR